MGRPRVQSYSKGTVYLHCTVRDEYPREDTLCGIQNGVFAFGKVRYGNLLLFSPHIRGRGAAIPAFSLCVLGPWSARVSSISIFLRLRPYLGGVK